MQQKQKIQLEDLEKKQVYTVPDNYFENLPANIRRRVNASQNSEKHLFYWIRYSLSLASIVLVLVAGYIWMTRSPIQNPNQLISEVAYAEIVDYLQAQELSQYDIIEVASDADITFDNDNQFFQQTDINSELLMEEADVEILQEYI